MPHVPPTSAPTEFDKYFESSIKDIGIPPCPLILQRFMSEAGKDEPDYRRLEHILGTDVGLAASLIKTANSAFFGSHQPARSVHGALTILGLKTSIVAVAGIVLRQAFPKLQNLQRFWDGSARISRLSGWLALQLDIRGLRSDDAYTFGLFRDCGIAVLLGRFPDYQGLLAVANLETQRSFTAVEEAGIPTNHAQVGSVLAQNWGLPEDIVSAIRAHHDFLALASADSGLTMTSRRLIATSQLAEHMVQNQLKLSMTEEWCKLGPACRDILHISEVQLDALYLDATAFIAS